LACCKRLQAFRQGHSKKPAGDESDRFGAILAEVFAGLRHGHAAGTNEVQNEIADGRERARPGSDTAAILVECHVAHIVKPVFDGPVGA